MGVKQMKKFILPLFVALFIVSFSSCSYVSYKDYYTNPYDYEKIWSLSGFGYDFEGVSEIFPRDIGGLNVKKFFCRYDQQLPLGEGVQLVLQINYDEDSYEKECNRIKPISYECNDFFSEIDLSFYAKRLCEAGISEYVAFDKQNFCVYYIYLQHIPKSEIEFDYRLLPDRYSGYGEFNINQ